ncbi:MAG: LPP20 family lipoprotein [Treponema sp.]|nr:LPP20 family lipoprotein [Treponema sp.]
MIYLLCIFFFACTVNTQAGGSQEAQPSRGPDMSAEADAAAQDAARRLDDVLSGRNSGTGTQSVSTGTSGSGTGTYIPVSTVQATSGGSEPSWVLDPYTAYPRNTYLAAVGYAANRADAEKSAFAALTAIFGQSIQANFEIVTVYSEAVRSGIVTVSDDTAIRDSIVTAASLDTLVGAEIGRVWENGRGMVYALAYLHRERTITVYTEMIRVNLANIERLISMTSAEKNTFDGYARYKLAALISGINAQYASVVTQVGGTTSSLNLTSADALNIEASNIIRNISVGVQVTGDRGNRVRDAFAGVLNTEGLRTRGNNPPYTLEVTISMEESVFPGNPNLFVRFTVSADLVENATDTVLLSFNFTDREGHTTLPQAENRAFILMERIVNERYASLFKEYLAALMPQH